MYINRSVLLLLLCGAGPLRGQSGLVSRCESFVPARTTTSAPLRLVCTVLLDSLRSLIANQARVDTGVELLSATARIRVALDSASVFERAYPVADALPAEYRVLLQHLRVRRSSINIANATDTEGTVTVDLDTARR